MVVTAAGVTNRLAEHALTLQFEALPPEVVQQTKGLFMDFLAVALGGRQVAESSAPIMQGMVDLTGGAKGKSTVLGEADLYPAHYAAMMNATLAHSMDYDDTHRVAIMHTGAPMFATLLALGEEYSVSGKEFLTAAVAGYDIANKIGKAHGLRCTTAASIQPPPPASSPVRRRGPASWTSPKSRRQTRWG